MAGLIKAFAYLRVSGKGQVDGDGFPRQKAAISAYADAHGIRIKTWFQEEGVSGTKDLENRPALQELMIALHSNGVRTVLIEKLDRLARDLMIQESVIADFQRSGFQLISVKEPDLCSDEPTRVLLRQMMGAFAQYERSMIVLKLRSARQRARIRDGRCEGRKPFGEREGEQDIIARIQKLADRGMNYTEIADKLNAEGLPTRANGQWFPATVSRILARTAQV
jgi:DNA invertase Pin-like site-specific DNA recombinase